MTTETPGEKPARESPANLLADTSRARLRSFGLGPYDLVLAMQEQLRVRRLADEIPDHWLVGEHPLVLTRGVRATEDDLLPEAAPSLATAPVFNIDRGGMTTLHSPGQLILYPIVKLAAGSISAGAFARVFLEGMRVWIHQEFGVETEIIAKRPGLFVDGRKLLSLGVSARAGVTMHGVALNMSNDLTLWRGVIACGEPEITPVSLTQILDRPVHPADSADALAVWLHSYWAYAAVLTELEGV